MRILMMTNSYAPVIGGIEESVRSFSEEFRRQGHRVIIVAPEFEEKSADEEDIVRVPAIHNFLREEFSVTLPIPVFLSRVIKEFQPDIIHSHHFFLVGDMAVRLARQYHIPLVFTHHIMLDQYVDFLPIHNEGVKRFILKLATGYANLADDVVAPSQAVAQILRQSGVIKPIHIIPTGVDVERFANGDGRGFRKNWTIPQDAFVIGCVCRLNPEKNLEFLSRAASLFLQQNDKAHCLIVGDGSIKDKIKLIFQTRGVGDRLHCTGVLQGQERINGYHAMDLFIFSSHSETQGLVLLESMAAGIPVAALDAPVVRELVRDYENGRLISIEAEDEFTSVMSWFARLNENELQEFKINSRVTAQEFSIECCAKKLLDLYEELRLKYSTFEKSNNIWETVMDGLKTEKDLLKNALEAGGAAIKERSIRGNSRE